MEKNLSVVHILPHLFNFVFEVCIILIVDHLGKSDLFGCGLQHTGPKSVSTYIMLRQFYLPTISPLS